MFITKIIIRILLNITVILTVLFSFTFTLDAQIDTLHFDTKGKDLWLTFPPNYHIGKSNIRNKYDDSLYIFITCDKATNGIIEYTDQYGAKYSKNFSITDPSKIYTFSIFYENFELIGYNNSGDMDYRNKSERVAKQYFHITSENEVTAYAHNQANMTSDACLILPTDILGKNYFVMSYNSDGRITSYSGNLSTTSTPSQFVVLATEDSTVVTIIPKEDTQFNNRNIQNIILNKGEAYLVQAKITISNLRVDLTGSEVHSNKPVAVFAGHQRSTMPNKNAAPYPTRDYLLEQMPPIETWGQNALIVPFKQPYNITQDESDIYRILSANDNTKLYINGVFIGNLNKGEFYENNISGPAYVSASAPVLVAQFKQSSDLTKNISNNYGDPFEMMIPPVEQFMNYYRVINTQANQYSNAEQVYVEQYITIVATDSSMASVRLDGNPIQLSGFLPIPTSNYYYTHAQVNDGVHTISCNSKIGVYVYGYGDANSYGYVGGMSMETIDVSPPQFAVMDSCFSTMGAITDTVEHDSKIISVISPPESQVNVNVKIESFNPLADKVNFSAKLNNFYDDGEFEIIATDSMGLYSIKEFEIPGFTLSVKNFKSGMNIPLHKDSYRIGKQFCYPVVIENYGKHKQIINNLILNNKTDFSILYSFPSTIYPGECDTALICFSSQVDTILIDTLSITGECGIRKIQAFDVTLWGDSKQPAVRLRADPCNKFTDVSITDSTLSDFGLTEVKIIDTVNCQITIEKFLPEYELLHIEVIDQNKDAIYHLTALDSAGHQIDVIDTVQGFTITLQDINHDTGILNFDSSVIGCMKCQNLKIYNYGILPFILDNNIYLKKNLIFSIPQSNIPVIINPGCTEYVKLCFSPNKTDKIAYKDTLVIDFNCMTKLVFLEGIANPEITNAKSRCEVPIVISIEEIPYLTYLEQNIPNPAENTTSIKFGVAEECPISLKIYDLYGNFRKNLIESNLKPGKYEVKFSLEKLEQGTYFYVMSTCGQILSKTMIVAD